MATLLVVGGGLAGITAALAAADSGVDVTLIESRPRLGGATSSFRRGELWIDTGQHLFLRCCTAYQEFLARIGSASNVTIQDRLDIPVLMKGARRARLRRSRLPLPAPLHLAGALSGYQALSPAERSQAVAAALRLGRLDVSSPTVDEQTFGEWLRAARQSPRAVEALWSLVTVATLNTRPDEASLALAAMVFQTGLLGSAAAADIGLPTVPLQQLHGDASAAALAEAGVDVRLGVRAQALLGDGRLGATTESGDITADSLILAVPHDVAATLLPDGTAPGTARLRSSPIVNVHTIFDRRVLDVPFAALLDGELQWVFDRTHIAGLAGPGQYLAASVSAADDVVGLPVAALRERFLPQFVAAFPAAASANVVDFFVTREPAATFRQVAGTAALRPGAVTDVPGLFLAGAWTATGWPATMEGAVRSGTAAASAALTWISHRASTEGALL